MKRIKPFISTVYERKGKTRMLPVNANYHELVDFADALGLVTKEDEDEMRIAHYKARLPLLLTPTDADNTSDVAATDECLRRLSPAQADAVINLCTVFGLQFNSLLEVIENTIKMKERPDND